MTANHLRILISIWLITTFILRLLFTSDIQALLLAKREIDIDSFEQLIQMTNIIPMIEENSSVDRKIAEVCVNFMHSECYLVFRIRRRKNK